MANTVSFCSTASAVKSFAVADIGNFNIKSTGTTYGGSDGVASILANSLLKLVQVKRYRFFQKFRLLLFFLEVILLGAILGYY